MSTIKIKKSSVSGRIPSPSDLEYGELAINIADGKLYFKNSSNVIQSFNTSFSDSSGVVGLIDSDFVQSRQATGLDSADIIALANSVENQAFNRFLVSGQFDVVADSTQDTVTFAAGDNIVITTTPDDDTITFASTALDSSAAISLIDSSYVQARQTLGGGSFSDSAAVSSLIDSSYVSARVPTSSTSFSTVAVTGVGSTVADQAGDTLNLTPGTNITMSVDTSSDTITINSTASATGTLDFGTIATPAGFTLDLGAI
tara:strand:+ start:492 stop:1265 length:774 start_codon:yes stop_codon:yes gene_type:complete